MKLTLLRHGITEGNARRLYYGSADLPLLPEGVADLKARRTAGGYPEAAAYYTSGMRRTEQTFAILYGDRPHRPLPELREMDFGKFEMQSYEQLKDDPAYQKWITGDIEKNVCPGGESAEQVNRRALRAVRYLLSREEDAVCVIHGGVIGGLMALWFAGGGRYSWTPLPGCGWQVTFENGIPTAYEKVPGPWQTESWK